MENKKNMNEQEFMILPDGSKQTFDDFKSRINNNVAICGASGSSKTRNFIIPNLLEATGSYIVTDPKGNLYRKYGDYLKSKGLNVGRVSFVNPSESMHYNPFEFLKSTQDIQVLTSILVAADKSAGTKADPFWDNMTVFMLNSVIGYIYETKDTNPECYNIPYVLDLLRKSGRTDALRKQCKFAEMIEALAYENPDSWAVKQYENVKQAPNKTYDTIVSTTLAKFSVYDTKELHKMLKFNEVDFVSIGKSPSALFVEISDTDTAMTPIINLFFSQAIKQLCLYADSREDSRLPIPTRFMLDDFPSIHIENFDVIISNIRSRKISATIAFQSLSQLVAGYRDNYATILDNCDTFLFMGTNTPETASMIARRCNKSEDTILHMPLNKAWIFRRGQQPNYVNNFDLEEYIAKNHSGVYSSKLDSNLIKE